MIFNIGNSVVVKIGVKAPELNNDIGGCQGRISEIQDNDIVCIDWDSITLNELPSSVIKKCEQEGWGWDQMYLEISDIELTAPRDTDKDVKNMVSKLENEYAWFHLGEEGERIQSVLSGVEPDDCWSAFQAWQKHLKNKLTFPCKAIVNEYQERGGIKEGNKVTIHGISEIEEFHGILVSIEYKREDYVFPLADLEIIGNKSDNYSLIKDYVIWFSNRQ